MPTTPRPSWDWKPCPKATNGTSTGKGNCSKGVKYARDSGAGSLRDTLAAASSNDTIVFDPSLNGQMITLSGGELAITKSLDIEGPGASQLAINGNDASRVFDISSGSVVTIAGLTITHGRADGSAPDMASAGGGILNLGALTLAYDVFSANQALGDASASLVGNPGLAGGGGVASFGTLTVSGTTFTSNLAQGANSITTSSAGNADVGGAVGGAIFSAGPTSTDRYRSGSSCSARSRAA
jgi:hypothetical protein